jgi:pimeloyl-ACP methyl ester carboxylesterase
MRAPEPVELRARSGDVVLAGSLWTPGHAVATLLMHPGSGPSSRDNDVYFPEIRSLLIEAGIAVASFDKRGVGGSTGRWQDAGIVEQAGDLVAAVETVRSAGATGPVGIFGHSQGGWVVAEAAARGAPVDFVVSNSGPGVTPAMQDRFSIANAARRDGRSVEDTVAAYDALVEALRSGAPRPAGDAASFVAGDDLEWALARRIVDHDPRAALGRITVPLLALFGADDEIVPIDESVAVFEREVRPDLLTVAVLPGGDHRIQGGDPKRLVDGYSSTLVSFIRRCAARPA